jgi:gas vesicle protein
MKFVLGLLVGFGLGVAAGLILAPQSGGDTLAQLGQQSVVLSDRSASIIDQIRSRATDALAQGREVYDRTKGELSERYSQARSGQL